MIGTRKILSLVISLWVSFMVAKALKDQARDNGDIYIINSESFDGDVDDISTTTQKPRDSDFVDFDEIHRECNKSFVTPENYLTNLNNTGALPDEKDKTSMCYVRCYFEKSGILSNFQLVPEMVQKHLWPATGDSIEFCGDEAKNKTDACERSYAVMKCALTRALTDARNKPMV